MSVTWDEVVKIAAQARYEAWVKTIGLSNLPEWLDLYPTVRDDFYATESAALSAIRAAGVRLMPAEASSAAAMAGLIAQKDAPVARDLGVSAMKAAYTAMRNAGEIKPEDGE